MTTSSAPTPSVPATARPLRLRLSDKPPAGGPHGVWWPRSRNLQAEAADLVDHFPPSVGRINRLLFSRPDWDDSTVGGRGVRSIRAARGPVKVGSFPSDDTHLMILAMASGQQLKLMVIPSGIDPAEGERRLGRARETSTTPGSEGDLARWDTESPAF